MIFDGFRNDDIEPAREGFGAAAIGLICTIVTALCFVAIGALVLT